MRWVLIVVIALAAYGAKCEEKPVPERPMKIMLLTSDATDAHIAAMAASPSSYPDFDGVRAHVRTATALANAQSLMSARSDARFYWYMSLLEYPFSASAGLAEHAWWNWLRSNVQFDGVGGATKRRMLVGSAPDAVGCFDTYCVTTPIIEYYELFHWPEIESSLADTIAAQCNTLAQSVSALKGTCFFDQTWLRLFEWMTTGDLPCGTHQSAHGSGWENGPLPAATYAELLSTYGGYSGTFADWTTNIVYFVNKMRATEAAPSLCNGEFRRGTPGEDNYDAIAAAQNNSKSVPMPIYLENVFGGPTGYTFEQLKALWLMHQDNVLELRIHTGSGFTNDKQQILDAWKLHGGWVALVPHTGCTWGDSLYMSVWNEFVTERAAMQSAPGTTVGYDADQLNRSVIALREIASFTREEATLSPDIKDGQIDLVVEGGTIRRALVDQTGTFHDE